MVNTTNRGYYKCVFQSALCDNNISLETFYPLLKQCIKAIIAENIDVDIMSIITEIMEYLLILEKSENTDLY